MADAVAVRMFLLKVLLVIVKSPFKCFSVFPGGLLEYRILQGERNVNTFFQFFLKNLFGIPGPYRAAGNGNKPIPGVGFAHCDIFLFLGINGLEKSIHEIKI